MSALNLHAKRNNTGLLPGHKHSAAAANRACWRGGAGRGGESLSPTLEKAFGMARFRWTNQWAQRREVKGGSHRMIPQRGWVLGAQIGRKERELGLKVILRLQQPSPRGPPDPSWDVKSARGAGNWAHLNVLDHGGREELAGQQNVPERGHLQLVDQLHPAPPQDLPVRLVHRSQTAGTRASSVRFRASAAAPRPPPRTRLGTGPRVEPRPRIPPGPRGSRPQAPPPHHLRPSLRAPPTGHTPVSPPRPEGVPCFSAPPPGALL